MISSLSTQNNYTPIPQEVQKINTAQADFIRDTLSNFDADNISESDAKSIVSQIKEAGIAPGRALTEAFAEEGFDAATIGEKSGVKGDRPPPPPPPPGEAGGVNGEINSEALSALTLLLETANDTELTEADWTEFYENLEEQGVDTSNPFVDIRV